MTSSPPSFISRLGPDAAASPHAVRAALPARYAPHDLAMQVPELGIASFENSISSEQIERHSTCAAEETVIAGVAHPSNTPHPRPQPDAPPIATVREAITSAAAPLREEYIFASAQLSDGTVTNDRGPRQAAPLAPNIRPEDRVGAPRQLTPQAPLSPTLKAYGPLMPGTVIERVMATQRTEPDIVQVTIDRIDVRLPNDMAASNHRPEQRRRPAPSQSLGDYLRGSKSGPRSDR